MGSNSRLFPRIVVVAVAVLLATVGYWAVRSSPNEVVSAQSGLGGPLPNLSSLENTMFTQGAFPFNKQWDFVQGLGPVFTQIGCEFCHITPVLGGNSTNKNKFFGTINHDGTFNPLASEGGSLLQRMTIEMFRSQCVLKGEVIPTDATIVATHQAPQTFGMGLIDNIPDSQILANAVPKGMGVAGVANIVPDYDGSQRVGHFGLKAQFASLLQIVAEAEGHDLSVTNPIVTDEDLPQGQAIPANCSNGVEPNDPGKQMMAMYHFLLYLAPSAAAGCSGNCANGQSKFAQVGCALCHIQPGTSGSYTTKSDVTVEVDWQGRIIHSKALSNLPVPLYSDLLLHKMGSKLADGLPQGLASGSMFRTTPLWGLSTRLSNNTGLLHDGRTKDPNTAILDHGGEATQSVNAFKALSPQDQADIIAFISTL